MSSREDKEIKKLNKTADILNQEADRQDDLAQEYEEKTAEINKEAVPALQGGEK